MLITNLLLLIIAFALLPEIFIALAILAGYLLIAALAAGCVFGIFYAASQGLWGWLFAFLAFFLISSAMAANYRRPT